MRQYRIDDPKLYAILYLEMLGRWWSWRNLSRPGDYLELVHAIPTDHGHRLIIATLKESMPYMTIVHAINTQELPYPRNLSVCLRES